MVAKWFKSALTGDVHRPDQIPFVQLSSWFELKKVAVYKKIFLKQNTNLVEQYNTIGSYLDKSLDWLGFWKAF